MPQKHHYIISPDDDRIFDVSTERDNTVARFDIHQGSSTHEASFNLPAVIREPHTHHNIAQYTAMQAYNDKIYAAAQTQSGVWRIFEIDELNATESTGRIWHSPGRKVHDMTIYQGNKLMWADNTREVHVKSLDEEDGAVTSAAFEAAATDQALIRSVSAIQEGSTNTVIAAAYLSARTEAPPSVTLRVTNGTGDDAKVGYLKIALKMGDGITANSRKRDKIYVALFAPALGTKTAAISTLAGTRPTQGNRVVLNTTSDQDALLIMIQLPVAADGTGTTLTLAAIKALFDGATNSSYTTTIKNALSVTVTGDEDAFVDWGGHDDARNDGMKAWQLGSATSIEPRNTPDYLRPGRGGQAIGDYDDDDRPFQAYISGLLEQNEIYYTQTDLSGTDWESTSNRTDANSGSNKTPPPTGMALVAAGTVYLAFADGSVQRRTLSTGVFTATTVAIRESPGFDATTNTTTLSYSHQDNVLHVEGESITSLQCLKFGTGDSGNVQSSIILFDGHDKSLIILQADNSTTALTNIQGLDIPINTGLIKYTHGSATAAANSVWLLTTFSSQ